MHSHESLLVCLDYYTVSQTSGVVERQKKFGGARSCSFPPYNCEFQTESQRKFRVPKILVCAAQFFPDFVYLEENFSTRRKSKGPSTNCHNATVWKAESTIFLRNFNEFS